MAGKRSNVAEVVGVLHDWQAGRSHGQMPRRWAWRVRLQRIVEVAEAAGLSTGGAPLSREEWAQRVPSCSRSGGRWRHSMGAPDALPPG